MLYLVEASIGVLRASRCNDPPMFLSPLLTSDVLEGVDGALLFVSRDQHRAGAQLTGGNRGGVGGEKAREGGGNVREGRRKEGMDGKLDDLEKWRIREILGFGASSLQVPCTTLLNVFF